MALGAYAGQRIEPCFGAKLSMIIVRVHPRVHVAWANYPTAMKLKAVVFTAETFCYGASKRAGYSVVKFTQVNGAASSLNRLFDEITRYHARRKHLVEHDLDRKHML